MMKGVSVLSVGGIPPGNPHSSPSWNLNWGSNDGSQGKYHYVNLKANFTLEEEPRKQLLKIFFYCSVTYYTLMFEEKNILFPGAFKGSGHYW